MSHVTHMCRVQKLEIENDIKPKICQIHKKYPSILHSELVMMGGQWLTSGGCHKHISYITPHHTSNNQAIYVVNIKIPLELYHQIYLQLKKLLSFYTDCCFSKQKSWLNHLSCKPFSTISAKISINPPFQNNKVKIIMLA